jgi:hypothetical protein
MYVLYVCVGTVFHPFEPTDPLVVAYTRAARILRSHVYRARKSAAAVRCISGFSWARMVARESYAAAAALDRRSIS